MPLELNQMHRPIDQLPPQRLELRRASERAMNQEQMHGITAPFHGLSRPCVFSRELPVCIVATSPLTLPEYDHLSP